MKRLFTAAALAALSLCIASAAHALEFGKNALRLPGELVNLAAEDFDGDGLRDVAAFCLSGEGRRPGKTVSVFYQRRGSSFPQNPDQTWPLDPEAVVFDTGDVGGTGKKAICYVRPDGLYAYMPADKGHSAKPVQLIKASGVFSNESYTSLPRWQVLMGGGKGPLRALIPSVNRLLVHSWSDGGFRQVNSLPLSTQTGFVEDLVSGEGPLTITHRIPLAETVGYNQAAAQDLMVTWDDNADIWLRKDGGFAEKGYLRFRPGLMEARKDIMDNASVTATDLDGDGRCDMVVTKMSGGVAQTKTLVFIYMRRPDGGFNKKPGQTIITEGVIGPRILDMDGDGRKDIVLPSVRMGLNNFINMLTSKQINMNIGIYLQDKNGRYPVQPTKVKAVTFKLDVSNMGKNARPVMAFGKFGNSRGYGLVVASKEERVSVYLPDRYSVLGDNPAVNLSVKAPSEMELVDMNGDGADDIVMSYRRVAENAREVDVFLSKVR